MIYFVRDELAGVVKIGFSRNPWGRFSKIQSDHPAMLTMWAVLEGELADEAALHTLFRANHLRGEWFRADGVVGAWVAAALADGRAKSGRVRKARGIKNSEIADAVGISHSYVSLLLTGARKGTPELAIRIFNATGVRIPLVAAASLEDIAILTRFYDRQREAA